MRPTRPLDSSVDAPRNGEAHRRAGGSPSRMAPTAAKALRVIELLAAEPSTPFSLAEMQRRLGYSHGNLHAICTTLVAMGHLRRGPGERTYRLGPALLSIGAAARAALPSVDVALPFLHTLAAELDTECHAAMRSGDSIIVVARVGTPQLDYGVQVGERFPVTPPLGSTFVAWATPAEREDYLASAADVLSPAELERCRVALESVLARGYSIHVDVEPSRKVRDTAARIVEEASTDERDTELRSLVHELGRHDYLAAEIEQIRAGTFVQVSAPAFNERGEVELSVGASLRALVDGQSAVRTAGERAMATAGMVTRAIGGRAPAPSR